MEMQLNLIYGFSVGFELVFVDPADYREFGPQYIFGLDLGIFRLTCFFQTKKKPLNWGFVVFKDSVFYLVLYAGRRLMFSNPLPTTSVQKALQMPS